MADLIGALNRVSKGFSVEESSCGCTPIHVQNSRGCTESTEVCRGSIATSFCTQYLIGCGSFRAVLCESRKESFERPLPDFIEVFGGFSFF